MNPPSMGGRAKCVTSSLYQANETQCGARNYARREKCFKCFLPSRTKGGLESNDCLIFIGFADEKMTRERKNDGSMDCGDIESPFLLIRPIQLSAVELWNLVVDERACLVRPQRVWIIRHRDDKVHCRFGFLEFSSSSLASQALNSNVSINDQVLKLSRIHAGVFIPIHQKSSHTFYIHGQAVEYWDDACYAEEYRDPAQDEQIFEPIKVSLLVNEKTMRKRKPTPLYSPALLGRWQRKQQELYTAEDVNSPGNAIRESFAEERRKACLLCRRKFDTMADVHRHERLSQMHLRNLSDPEKMSKARDKLKSV